MTCWLLGKYSNSNDTFSSRKCSPGTGRTWNRSWNRPGTVARGQYLLSEYGYSVSGLHWSPCVLSLVWRRASEKMWVYFLLWRCFSNAMRFDVCYQFLCSCIHLLHHLHLPLPLILTCTPYLSLQSISPPWLVNTLWTVHNDLVKASSTFLCRLCPQILHMASPFWQVYKTRSCPKLPYDPQSLLCRCTYCYESGSHEHTTARVLIDQLYR